MFERGISEAMLQRAIVGEQEQALAIAIQASNRINAGKGHVLLQCVPGAGKLAQHIERLIEENVAERQITDYRKGRSIC